jgi:hypothetical protein
LIKVVNVRTDHEYYEVVVTCIFCLIITWGLRNQCSSVISCNLLLNGRRYLGLKEGNGLLNIFINYIPAVFRIVLSTSLPTRRVAYVSQTLFVVWVMWSGALQEIGW